MKKLYLITGATGHIGTVLVSTFKAQNALIRVLVLPQEKQYAPKDVQVCEGDVTDIASLKPFFNISDYEDTTLIHCAALITVSSKDNPQVWNVNVNGTENIMQMAVAAHVRRVIHVSSVHAIPEKPIGETITEAHSFSPDLVHGQYAKAKAAASEIVLEYARKGLNVSIVHPSGIIGPGDTRQRNHMIRTVRAMADGKIPFAIKGGYDFVDSRDVVQGILGCEARGKSGECYILSGHYISVLELLNIVRGIVHKKPVKIELPYGLMRVIASAAERFCLFFGQEAPLITPYSIYTLHTNGHFSCGKAMNTFDYRPRPIEETIRESL